MAYSGTLDEAIPIDTESVGLGASRIRALTLAVKERLESVFVDVEADPLVFKPFDVLGNVEVDGDLGVTDDLLVAGDTALGGLLTVVGAASFGALSATTISGNGAGITNLGAAQLTGVLPALNGAALTDLDAGALATGTIVEGRLPTTKANAYTFSNGGSAISITNSGNLAWGAPAGSPAAMVFPSGAAGYANPSTAFSVPGWTATGGPAGSGWFWIRVTVGASTGYLPVLF